MKAAISYSFQTQHCLGAREHEENKTLLKQCVTCKRTRTLTELWLLSKSVAIAIFFPKLNKSLPLSYPSSSSSSSQKFKTTCSVFRVQRAKVNFNVCLCWARRPGFLLSEEDASCSVPCTLSAAFYIIVSLLDQKKFSLGLVTLVSELARQLAGELCLRCELAWSNVLKSVAREAGKRDVTHGLQIHLLLLIFCLPVPHLFETK